MEADRRFDHLIARLSSPAQDDDLSADIALAVGTFSLTNNRWPTYPDYIGDLRASISLVPTGKYWHLGFGRTRDDEPLGGASVIEPGSLETISIAEAHTPERAMCIAALLAIDKLAGVSR